MPLQRSLTLANGITVPQAYGVEDWHLEGSKNIAIITITWWATKAAHDAGLPNIQTDTLTLTVQEQTAGEASLIGVLDTIILARPEYFGASTV